MSRKYKTQKRNADPIEELLDEITLEEEFETILMMTDVLNWDNGTYKGDKELIRKQAESCAKTVELFLERALSKTLRKSRK